ncbi:MAG TPA: tetratricopeptide repeat protein, partial [Rhodanobacteraceae bacterium]
MIASGKAPRTFANLPGAPAAATDRLAGLSREERAALTEASQRISSGELGAAEQLLRGILAAHPDHTETLRMLAVAYHIGGHTAEAIGVVRHAQRTNPSDALLMNTLGSLLQTTGDVAGGGIAFRRACELDPELASAWMNLGTNLSIQSDVRQAESAFARAVELQPQSVNARILHANALNALGRTDEAIAEFRAAIAANPRAAHAWAGLAEIKTVALTTEDIGVLERLVADPALGEDERAVAGFALGRGLEDQQRYPDAFAAFSDANAAMRRLMPWDA